MKDKELAVRIEIQVPGLTMNKHFETFRDELRRLLPGMVQLAAYRAGGKVPDEVEAKDLEAYQKTLENNSLLFDVLELAKYQIIKRAE